jgi:hypothetical protein
MQYSSEVYVRSFCIAEFSTFNLNIRIPLNSLVANFGSNMFTFAVTIRPNEQGPRVARLFLNIFRNA